MVAGQTINEQFGPVNDQLRPDKKQVTMFQNKIKQDFPTGTNRNCHIEADAQRPCRTIICPWPIGLHQHSLVRADVLFTIEMARSLVTISTHAL